MNQEYRIYITNNDPKYQIQHINIDITDIVNNFGYKFAITDEEGTLINFSYEADNGEVHKYLSGTVVRSFPIGQSQNWKAVNDKGLPVRVWIRLNKLLSSYEVAVLTVRDSNDDCSTSGENVFLFYEDFNNTLDSLKWNLESMNFSLSNGALKVWGNMESLGIFSRDVFNLNNSIKMNTRFKISNITDSINLYFGLGENNSAFNEEKKLIWVYDDFSANFVNKYSTLKPCSNNLINTNWNHGYYVFSTTKQYLVDTINGNVEFNSSYTPLDLMQINIGAHTNTSSSTLKYGLFDYIILIRPYLVDPSIIVKDYNEKLITYNVYPQYLINYTPIDISEVQHILNIQTNVTESDGEYYIRFAFSFDGKNPYDTTKKWVVIKNGVWQEILYNELIGVDGNNVYNSLTTKGMTSSTITTITQSMYDTAMSLYGGDEMNVLVAYKGESKVFNKEVFINMDTIKWDYDDSIIIKNNGMKLRLISEIVIDNSLNEMNYNSYQFRINVERLINEYGDNIDIVDENGSHVNFTFEFENGECYQSLSMAPSHAGYYSGYIWINYSINAGSLKKLNCKYSKQRLSSHPNDIFIYYEDFSNEMTLSEWIKDNELRYLVSNGILKVINKKGLSKKLNFNINNGYAIDCSLYVENSATDNTKSGIFASPISSEFINDDNTNADSCIVLYCRWDKLMLDIGKGNVNYFNVRDGYQIKDFIYGRNIVRSTCINGNYVKIIENNDFTLFEDNNLSFYKNMDHIRIGYYKNSDIEIMQYTYYDWIRIRKWNNIEPAITVNYRYDLNDIHVIKQKSNCGVTFNLDYIKDIVNFEVVGNVLSNTNVRFLFSFDNCATWKKWVIASHAWMDESLVFISTNGNRMDDIQLLSVDWSNAKLNGVNIAVYLDTDIDTTTPVVNIMKFNTTYNIVEKMAILNYIKMIAKHIDGYKYDIESDLIFYPIFNKHQIINPQLEGCIVPSYNNF